MLSQDLTRYTELHHFLGFKFRIQHSLLRNFVTYAEAQWDEFVRVDRVLNWAARAPSPPQRRNRLLTARRFALASKGMTTRDSAAMTIPGKLRSAASCRINVAAES